MGIWFRATVIGGPLCPSDDADAVEYFPLEAPPPLAFPTDRLVREEVSIIMTSYETDLAIPQGSLLKKSSKLAG